MRKTNLLFTVLCFVLVLCTLTGCDPLTACTGTEFIKAAEEKGFTVRTVVEEDFTVTVADNGEYNVFFYEFKDVKTAEDNFAQREEIFDSKYHTKTMSLEKNGSNYNYYSFTADGEFHIASQVDGTLFYCEAAKGYKDDILALAKELGYR